MTCFNQIRKVNPFLKRNAHIVVDIILYETVIIQREEIFNSLLQFIALNEPWGFGVLGFWGFGFRV